MDVVWLIVGAGVVGAWLVLAIVAAYRGIPRRDLERDLRRAPERAAQAGGDDEPGGGGEGGEGTDGIDAADDPCDPGADGGQA